MSFRALSLFSSAGVAEAYFARNGVEVRVASELLPERAALYRHLYPGARMFQGDITCPGLFADILAAAEEEGCDFIMATPPCQGMSSAGLQRRNDPRNRLIIHVVEAIQRLKPRYVIIENVPEILQTSIDIGGSRKLIDAYLQEELGAEYRFNKSRIVNAMHYGVPQSRERCIYLLAAKSEGVCWEFPPPSDTLVTMREAIGGLPSLDPEVTDIPPAQFAAMFPDFERRKAAGLAVSPWHCPPRHKCRHVIAMMHTPEGRSAWFNEKYYPTLADGTKSKGYKNTYKRQWWDKPAYTVTRYTSRLGSQENGHPGHALVESEDEEERLWSDARVLTIFELMRLSSLPDDWNLPRGMSHNVIREVLGEGVPPLLIEAALKQLREGRG